MDSTERRIVNAMLEGVDRHVVELATARQDVDERLRRLDQSVAILLQKIEAVRIVLQGDRR